MVPGGGMAGKCINGVGWPVQLQEGVILVTWRLSVCLPIFPDTPAASFMKGFMGAAFPPSPSVMLLCPSAFLRHVGRACPLLCLQASHACPPSSPALGCSIKAQTPKFSCQLTPHVCNPKSHLPPLPPACLTLGFPILGSSIRSITKIPFWAVSLTSPLLPHFHQ